MTGSHFTHLHLHTDFSLLDGAITIPNLVQFGKNNHYKALAITDHGNIFGAVKFFQECKKNGIKPILGMEAYFTNDALIKQADNKYYHLILLVQNEIGYRNLCKLISYSFQRGFYFKPRIDYKQLEQYHDGLIVTSGCLGGHIPKLLMSDQESAAHEKIDWFLRVFGPERFYLEVQPEDQPEQKILNNKLYQLSTQKGVPLLATGDCHYVHEDDRYAHEVMLAVQTHDTMDNAQRYTFGDCRVYMRTTQQMLNAFAGHEQAVWNAGVIADMCSFDFQTGKLFFPNFQIPAHHSNESFFQELCIEGFEKLIQQNRISAHQVSLYRQRLEQEIELICAMGFVGYFLIVSDFIRWARAQGIPVGPGRGSAAGSLVAWCLEITNIDPIAYNLLFERFLNPERVSMPDIDIDFCIEGRETVINYVREKYGADKVCQIITFGTMLAKGVIKDVARTLGFSFEDSNAITQLIPDQLKITLEEAIAQEPRLKQLIDNNGKVKQLFDVAFKLEGLTRHASKHAAGIVITPESVDSLLPIYIPSKTTDLVTQYAMSELEYLGFLKIDFLGLKNLTLIDRTVRMIQKNYGISINIDMLPLDDPKTFALMCAGNTSGVFQLESAGLKEVLRKLQPTKFEDIIAVNALYRPGPLGSGSGMVDDFIERKHGRQKIVYLFPELESILQETYGVIVYQEQVMKIASTIAGYSLGQSDILRRAMGKKKTDVMAEQRELFLQGADAHNFDRKKSGELFDLMAYFAGYGFNKSHSAAYSMISYQTAYLKANYPAEFMACLITLEATNAEKMAFYLEEAKHIGITIVPPDINRSEICFSVCDSNILFGLQGIKNVGLAALENIIKERQKGPFEDIFNFCTRIDLRICNKRVIEFLICGGAFDQLAGTRTQKYTELSSIMDKAIEYKKRKETGQLNLFGMPEDSSTTQSPSYYQFQPTKEWSTKEKLDKEKEAVGFYMSEHPLTSYQRYIKYFQVTPFHQMLEQAKNNASFIGCGIIKNKRIIMTKKGDRMAFVQLEDITSSAEVILFPKLFQKVADVLDSHHIFLVKGSIDNTSTQTCKIKAESCIPLELIFQSESGISHINLRISEYIDQPSLAAIQQLLVPGSSKLTLSFQDTERAFTLHAEKKIKMSPEIAEQLEKQYKIFTTCFLS